MLFTHKTFVVYMFLTATTATGTANGMMNAEDEGICSAIGEELTVCIYTPHRTLTVNRDSGSVHIYVTARTSKPLSHPIDLFVSISAPANPSDINLESGLHGTIGERLTIQPGKELKDVPVFFIKLAKGNIHSGRLTYSILTKVAEGGDQAVKLVGSQLQVEVVTIP